MRLVIQRVKSASLSVDGKSISEIGFGLMVFAGVCEGDTMQQVTKAANKISTIRIFEEDEKMNKNIHDVDGEVLLISNFTLCTKDTSGARPDFTLSADRETAKSLYLALADELDKLGVKVKLGVFGADMQINSHLDGPITIYKEIK
ncbi:MAG: D-tyrosyl-tRNA(Tyr) deacylase [Cyanobacteria bacterium SIG30]|nr:D-tyrosyl-tRNA(Tyr) deacylase [Cyanobacteria bacterium SIG30]